MVTQRLAVVVDGNAPDRMNTVGLLEAAGYQVRSASSFDEAKTLLAAEHPHLLVTDLRLGQYNGIHLVLRSRNDHPGIVAVVTSRVADPVLEAEVHRQNAHFLLRPLTGPQLLEAIASPPSEIPPVGAVGPVGPVGNDAPHAAHAPQIR